MFLENQELEMHRGPRVVPNVVLWKAVLKIVPLKVTPTVFPIVENLAKSKKSQNKEFYYIFVTKQAILFVTKENEPNKIKVKARVCKTQTNYHTFEILKISSIKCCITIEVA